MAKEGRSQVAEEDEEVVPQVEGRAGAAPQNADRQSPDRQSAVQGDAARQDSVQQDSEDSVQQDSGIQRVEQAPTFTDPEAAFYLMRVEIERQPNNSPKITVPIGPVVQSATWAVHAVEAVGEAALTEQVPNYDVMALLRRLKATTLALNYLQARLRVLKQPVNLEVVNWLNQQRNLFELDVRMLVERGVLHESQVPSIRADTGRHTTAYDVMALAEVLLDHYEAAQEYLPPRKKGELMLAREKANELFLLLGTRQFGQNAEAELRLLRRKTFALLVALWTRLYAFVNFVRFDYGDADKLMPSLYPKRKSRKGKNASNTQPATDNEDDAEVDEPEHDEADHRAAKPPDEELLDPAAINRRILEANGPVPPGLPGSLPFRLEDDEDEKA